MLGTPLGVSRWLVRSLLPGSVELFGRICGIGSSLREGGDRWTVKLDVRDLDGHLDTTFRGWSATLADRVRTVTGRPMRVFVLPLDFHGRLRVVRTMLILGALHGIEASILAVDLRKLRSAICRVVWS